MKIGNTPMGEYVPVRKDILRKGASMGFSAQEQKVFWFIVEKTHGYQSGKDAKSKESIRKEKQTLSPNYIYKSIGVPVRTVRGIIDKLVDQKVIFVTKEPFPDKSGKMQRMTTIQINLKTDEWKLKEKKRPFIGSSVNEILNPKPDEKELQAVLDRMGEEYEYAEGEVYELELSDGTLEYFGEDIYRALARLDPFHPKLEKYYCDDYGWGEGKQEWILGFELYEERKLEGEACWQHKEKLVEMAKQGDGKKHGILDMVLIEGCQFCRQAKSGSTKESEVSH